MKNQTPYVSPHRLDPHQGTKNRRLALGLALFALIVFVTSIYRQWLASN